MGGTGFRPPRGAPCLPHGDRRRESCDVVGEPGNGRGGLFAEHVPVQDAEESSAADRSGRGTTLRGRRQTPVHRRLGAANRQEQLVTLTPHRYRQFSAATRANRGLSADAEARNSMAPPNSLVVGRFLGTIMVAVHGELYVAAAKALTSTLRDLIEAGNRTVVVGPRRRGRDRRLADEPAQPGEDEGIDGGAGYCDWLAPLARSSDAAGRRGHGRGACSNTPRSAGRSRPRAPKRPRRKIMIRREPRGAATR